MASRRPLGLEPFLHFREMVGIVDVKEHLEQRTLPELTEAPVEHLEDQFDGGYQAVV